MTLLVDMGNSRMKAAYFSQPDKVDVFSYLKCSALDCLTNYIEKQHKVSSLTLVSVLGSEFEQAVKAYCLEKNIKLTWVTSAKQAQGVKSDYDNPLSLGSDRFVALVGAIKQYPKQYCIVVDCGTAVTIDGLTAEGEFQGGVILPGLQLWGQSLIGRTSQLDSNNLISPRLFATNTADAIGGGSVYGLVGAIEGVCLRMRQSFYEQGANDSSMKLILCGGDAELVAKHSQLDFHVLPNLVLTGLVYYS